MEKVFNGRIILKHDLTVNWETERDFIPKNGEIIIFDDYKTVNANGDILTYPNFKIGDGTTPALDLPFVSDDIRLDLQNHINDNVRHITQQEREFWNNKIRNENIVLNETLVFTKD